ncbi:cytochrome P450 [Schizophyllum commune]
MSLDTRDVGTVLATVGAIYVLRRILDGRHCLQSVGYASGPRTLLSQMGALANILPVKPPIVFEEADCDVIAAVSFWPHAEAVIHIAHAEAIKTTAWARQRFPKRVAQYSFLDMFGPNILTSEFDQWKFFRKVAAPAFSEHNNRLVWAEATRTIDELIDDVWKNEQVVHVDNFLEITLSGALHVIGGAGFGRNMSWGDDATAPDGHHLSYKECMVIVSTNIAVRLIYPDWFPSITKDLRRIRAAFGELEKYIDEMIDERRASKEERHDLLSRLLEENDGGDTVMSNREILSNIFIFLEAGHETIAHTLCFAFAFLALYPDKQEKVYEEIKAVASESGDLPQYSDMHKYAYTLAVIYETLRMFPPVVTVPKVSAQDQVVTGKRLSDGSKVDIPCPAGTSVHFAVVGLHNNPNYWDSPEEFRPERFLGDYNKDAFVPFSAGARACLGRKFAETEGVAMMVSLISRYKFEVMEEPQFAGETFAQRQERVLKTAVGLTLTPARVPLTFRRRD